MVMILFPIVLFNAYVLGGFTALATAGAALAVVSGFVIIISLDAKRRLG